MRVVTVRQPSRSSGGWRRLFSFGDRGSDRLDYWLLGAILALTIFGLLMLSSASSIKSFREYDGDTYYFVRHQFLYGVLPGLIAFWYLIRFDYRRLQRLAWYQLAAAGLLLLLIFTPLGVRYNGVRSWISIAGIVFQPAEFVKLLIILFFGTWFAQRGKELTADFWNGLAPFAFLIGLVALPIILQPDIGTLSVIVSIAFAMYAVAGARRRHLGLLILAAVMLFGLLIVVAPYRLNRFLIFLNPGSAPLAEGYQVNQGMLAIGSGGFFGVGFGQSRQKFSYLPEVIGDSIFAVIGEELGFFFAVLLIGVFCLIALRGLRAAQRAPDLYGRYIAVGIVSWFTLQAFLNIAAMVGLMPLTGIPLPFVSYGGSSMVSILAAAGILVNISRQQMNSR